MERPIICRICDLLEQRGPQPARRIAEILNLSIQMVSREILLHRKTESPSEKRRIFIAGGTPAIRNPGQRAMAYAVGDQPDSGLHESLVHCKDERDDMREGVHRVDRWLGAVMPTLREQQGNPFYIPERHPAD